MELLQQVSEIVEGVIINLSEKLGSDAEEHICLDELHERAKVQLQNSCSVQEAIKHISSSLQWHIRGKLEEKFNRVKKIRDELERTSEGLIVKQIRESLEQATERFQQNPSHTAQEEVHTIEPQTSSQPDSSSVGEASNSVVSSTSTTLDDRQLHEDHKNISSGEDDDVVVVSPVPREPAPLILLSDDSCENTSSSTGNGGVSIVNLTKSQKENAKPDMNAKDFSLVVDLFKDFAAQQQMHKRELEIDLEDAKKSLADLRKDERTLNERINEIKSEEKRCIDNIDNTSQSSSPVGTVDNDDASRSASSPLSENMNSHLLNSHSSEAKLETCTDENKNTASKVDVLNFLITHQPEESHPDELWEDAHFVCSLLPYFTLKDVHQTMVDNLHHPDRRAYVLEAYINLAVDRQEPVQDAVFQGLWAARKRPHGELADSHAECNIKKRKIELEPEAYMKGLRDNEAVPSTSKAANNPMKVNEPGMSTDINTDISPSQVKDPVIEKWHEEKMDFVCAVVHGVDRKLLWIQIQSCQTDADIEALVERLMEEQDQVAKHSTITVLPYQGQDQPSTSAFQPVAIAGPSYVVEKRDEPVPGQSSEESVTGEEDQGGQAADLEDKILAQVKTLTEMFADADPDYLQERCVANNGDAVKFQEVVDTLLQQNDYPKIEEYHRRQKRLEIKKKFVEGMSVEEFLEYFEDPEKVFCDTSTTMSPTYIENARTQLKRDLPFHLIRDIENTFKKHNHHYLPTLRALQDNGKLLRRKTKRTSNLKERDLDDIFIKELCYVRMQTEIKEHLWKKEEDKRWSFLQAKAKNQLQECRCCYDDEVLQEDMEPCSSETNLPHKFCVSCIRRFVEEEIGQGRTSFRCLEGECKAEFSLATLKKVMKPSIFSNILERKQQEEIAAAGIEDLVACPFCNFQTIMPNPEDKVFKCLNPECMKDSCRYCKEPNHVPLRCEEVEKQHQRDTRVFLENKMTEAMVRECWKCKKRFIKEDGCNKMVCPCGAMMCYICKKPIKGYNHFEDKPNPRDSKKCPLWSNSKIIHAEEVRDAAMKLKSELNPSIELPHNPLDDLPEVPQDLAKQHGGQPPQHLNAPQAHQQQVLAHPVGLHRMPPVAHVAHRDQAMFHLPAPPPPPAHRQLPPAPPAHRQLHPALAVRVVRPPAVVAMAEVNQFQHHHHHHFHHHHMRPLRQDPPPVHLLPNQHLRDDFRAQVNEFDFRAQVNEFNEVLMEIRNRGMDVMDGRAQWEAMDQMHGVYNQQQPQQQQQQQQQRQQGLRQPYTR